MFSSPSYSEWTKVSEGVDGDTFYVDFERIRKVDGYVYHWDMVDYLKPISGGYLSIKSYGLGDCKMFRFKYINNIGYRKPMGVGTGQPDNRPTKWYYPSPNSVNEKILKSVCSR